VEDSGITSVWVRELICEFVQTVNYDVPESKIPQVGPDSSDIYAGMDAQVSYEFHSERKRNPEKFKNQLTNQV
jgi:hypothetical protein